MSRILLTLAASLSLTMVSTLFSVPASAEGALPGLTRVAAESAALPATRVEVGPELDDMQAGPELIFHNGGSAPARLVFSRRDASALDCDTDGRATVYSRSGQYTLAAHAELHCRVAPGRYQYTRITNRDGAIDQSKGKLVVR